jgi:hypothetical protein
LFFSLPASASSKIQNQAPSSSPIEATQVVSPCATRVLPFCLSFCPLSKSTATLLALQELKLAAFPL